MKQSPDGHSVNEILNDKKHHVGQMFDRIARRYDFLNHFLSLGIDRKWRKNIILELKPFHPSHVLDVATGTGDLAIALFRKLKCRVTGIDVSENMMYYGMKKASARKLSGEIGFVKCSAEDIPFAINSFDAATVAFGVRNFGDLSKGLSEIFRVLKPGSPFAILEFSLPDNRILRGLYEFYLFRILPFAGRLISGDRAAYSYLPESIRTFPRNGEFVKKMKEAGFVQVSFRHMSGGIVSLYLGIKETE